MQYKLINKGEYVVIAFDEALTTVSSAMINAGMKRAKYFVNRTVPRNFAPEDVIEEYKQFLCTEQLNIDETVAMMTAVSQEHLFIENFHDRELSITVALTAGISNAVDITTSFHYAYEEQVGTINIFVFIDGQLTEESFMQAYSAVIEAKTKTLGQNQILDPVSKTIATSTSTDSVCVAATQKGTVFPYAGSITRLGSFIGKCVTETLQRSLDKYIYYNGRNES